MENKYYLKFNLEISNFPNKDYSIKNEINQIEYFMNNSHDFNSFFGISPNLQRVETNAVFNFNYFPSETYRKIFKYCVLNNVFIYENLEEEFLSIEDKEMVKDALSFAEYYQLLHKSKTSTSTKLDKSQLKLTLAEKILALDYLGIDLIKYDKTKSSRILNLIIDQNKDNIKDHLTNLYSAKKTHLIKNSKNLNTLSKVFDNEQFIEIQNKIREDLKKLG